MVNVEVYTTMFCGFCARAKRLLSLKGVEFTEFDVSMDAQKRAEMMERSNGGRTVPQIFINGQHIGGCNELEMLDSDGGLDPLLSA
jgi:glutaredoxin 3